MTDFVDPLEEPLGSDLERDRPLDPDVDPDDVDSDEADRQAAAEGTLSSGGVDGSDVTSASEGEPLDDTTPVDNLE